MHPLKPLARNLRKEQTDAERIIWSHIRNRQIDGTKFKRQAMLGKYIVDFLSYESKVIIEIDGGQHNDELQKLKDNDRTQWLEMKGYKVLRFWNNEVLTNLEGVLEVIHLTLTLSFEERE